MEEYGVIPNLDKDDIPNILGVRPDNISGRTLLCKRCQRFDIQSFPEAHIKSAYYSRNLFA
jgi:hypothetical protein